MKKAVINKILNKVKTDYNKLADDFDVTRVNAWPEFEIFKKYLKPDLSILDIGCGNGRLLESLPKKIDYLGIDNSSKLISKAKQKYKNNKFITEDILNFKFNNKFDLIMAIAVLNHVPSDKLRLQALNNIWRSLKPGGFLLMTNWNLYQKKYKHLILKNKNPDLEKGDALVPWRNPAGELLQERYYHSFTLTELNILAKKTSFKIIKQYYSLKGKPVTRLQGYNSLSIWQKTS